MKTRNIIALLAAVLCLAACNKNIESLRPERDIVYTVDQQSPTTVHLNTDEEWQELLDRFCEYAENGSSVTFRNLNLDAKGPQDQEPISFSSTDREVMRDWMERMENRGLTVTVTYNTETSVWSGIAYVSTSLVKRLSRVTMDIPGDKEMHAVYTYTWLGSMLTEVDMVEDEITHYTSNGVDTSSTRHIHNRAVMTYDGGLRTALNIYDGNNNLVKEYSYIYDNGRLSYEYQTDYSYGIYNIYNIPYFYFYQFMIRDWCFMADYLTCAPGQTGGIKFFYDSNSNFIGFQLPQYGNNFTGDGYDWSNGDLAGLTSSFNLLIYAYEYDNSPHPYGVSLGTTTLLPGYNSFMPYETQWSKHNLSHISGQTREKWINYTYNADGSIATAELPWTNRDPTYTFFYEFNGTIHWTFEYLD